MTSLTDRGAAPPRRGLYAIVDPDFCAGRGPVWVAERVLATGCCALQLRAKHAVRAALWQWGRALLPLCRRAGVPFIINDWPELAHELGADGVHLGQRDLPPARARAMLGREFSLGVSTHTLAQAREAQAQGADLIGFGPVFATQSKPDAEHAVGIERLREVCTSIALPVVAIGGIAPGNVAAVVAAGATMAAAIGAVCSVADPAAAARALHEAFSTPC